MRGHSPPHPVPAAQSFEDFVANHPHDGYFTSMALKSFVENAKAERSQLEAITFACDNGMVSGSLLWTLSRLKVEISIAIDVMPLAPYHAYSACDAHGAGLKGTLRRAACRDEQLGLQAIQAEVEATCARTTACCDSDSHCDTRTRATGDVCPTTFHTPCT